MPLLKTKVLSKFFIQCEDYTKRIGDDSQLLPNQISVHYCRSGRIIGILCSTSQLAVGVILNKVDSNIFSFVVVHNDCF